MTRRITTKQRGEVTQAIDHHEWLRRSYFWLSDNGNQRQRDWRAGKLSYSMQFRNGGHVYRYSSSVTMKRSSTYYRGEFTRDGVRGDVRLFKKLLV